ncbi:hypothetical protein ACMFMG_011933 [Clarireedia jacksonii]
MKLDLEAVAESSHATMPMVPQIDLNSSDISEERTEPGLQDVPHVGIRHRNTNQVSSEDRESTVPTADTEQASSEDEARSAKGDWLARIIKPLFPDCKTEEKVNAQNTSSVYDKLVDHTWEDFLTGIPKVARFQNSDPDFNMVRCFDLAHFQILIYRQNKIQRLQSKVLERDKRYAAMPKNSVEYRKLRGAQFILRKRDGGGLERLAYNINDEREGDIMEQDEMLLELEKELKEYHEVLLPYMKICAQKRPKWYQHRSVFNWTQNKKPLVPSAEEFIHHNQDFILLRQREGENWIKERLDAQMYQNRTSIFKVRIVL